MTSESVHISLFIARPAAEVYDFAADPENLPRWAARLSSGIEYVDGAWTSESPMGRVRVAFAPANEFGVLDHVVTLPDGQGVYNPFRVIADGADAAEVVFTLRRRPGVGDAEFAQDAGMIRADLERLRGLLQGS